LETHVPAQDSAGVVERIADGSMRIDSKEEYENLLHLFPDKAELHRSYADFLARQNAPEAAYQAYGKAADLFAQSKMALQAIVAKVLSWEIVKPDHEQGRLFHSTLQAGTSAEVPLQNFFAEMSYPELIAVMRRMVRVHASAEQLVIEHGAPALDIFLVVAGRLKETIYVETGADESEHTPRTKRLGPGDILGDVFPFDRSNRSRSDVEAITPAELIKISKPVLTALFRKFPRIELLLAKLYKGPPTSGPDRHWISVRRTRRHAIPIRVQLSVQADGPAEALAVEGFTRDISLDGACVDLDETARAAELHDPVGAAATLTINLPNADTALALSGRVVWHHKTVDKGKMRLALGIRFDNLRNVDRDMLSRYCFGGDGEQNLLWNLWETYMNA